MDYLQTHLMLFGLLSVTVFAVAAWLVYAVGNALYLNFLEFSRRFRGVE